MYPSALPRPTPAVPPTPVRPWSRAAARGSGDLVRHGRDRIRRRGRRARLADRHGPAGAPPRRERRAVIRAAVERFEAASARAMPGRLPCPVRTATVSRRGREAVGYARCARQPEEWTALPAATRRKPEPHTGEQLELELVGGSAVPRPARPRGTARASEPAEATPPAVPPEPGPAAVAPSTAVRRGPGRPPKVPAALALPPRLKARGGRRRGTPAPR